MHLSARTSVIVMSLRELEVAATLGEIGGSGGGRARDEDLSPRLWR